MFEFIQIITVFLTDINKKLCTKILQPCQNESVHKCFSAYTANEQTSDAICQNFSAMLVCPY
jgi:hypothetical protein